jgi:hypothetical protein
VSEKYSACVLSRLSEDRGSILFRTLSIPNDLASVRKDTVSALFGLK